MGLVVRSTVRYVAANWENFSAENLVQILGELLPLPYPHSPIGAGLGMFLTTLRPSPGKEATEGGFQTRQSVHYP
jgi:hypothetical protein